eukprot:CAMPEP_0117444364 /NCGR_PEP_ID=MMETSP0759-20121206/5203_1 /TAXON_ID=63605 /ORGANISM="Percolomonas cosmopolitus, Strain WS" /LENGTH=197 /DNA_ID=CAMNT_0005236429 /DNA_START=211 /DNA_END=804 /DNA_ORIENTATION=-
MQLRKLLERPKSRKLSRRRYFKEKKKQDEIFDRHYQEHFRNEQKLKKRNEEVEKILRSAQNKSHISSASRQMVGGRDHRGFRTLHDQMYADAMKRIEDQYKRDEEMYGFSTRPQTAMSFRSTTPSPTKQRIRQPDYERSWSRTPFLSRFEENMKKKQEKMQAKQEGFLRDLQAPRSFMSPHSKTLMKDKDSFWSTVK